LLEGFIEAPERHLLQGVADEGGYWAAFSSNEQALDALMPVIE
jgi:enolase